MFIATKKSAVASSSPQPTNGSSSSGSYYTAAELYWDAHEAPYYIANSLSSIENARPSHPWFQHFLFAQSTLIATRLERHRQTASCLHHKGSSILTAFRNIRRRLYDLQFIRSKLYKKVDRKFFSVPLYSEQSIPTKDYGKTCEYPLLA
ncbi:hypothetical protein HDV00_000506 [Rhizophlyctis rosea]|nr:hypothetical protein HDV00_000506 [Rhizophlyctis rosea]